VPPLVEGATAIQTDIPIYHEWVGVLDGFVNAHIRAQVTGYLVSQTYKKGEGKI
jgi:membrane fusion protein (multidrug efflux system)